MPRETLVSPNNQTLGYIETDSRGRQTLISPHNQVLGYFDPKSNQTITPNNQLVAYGNFLTSLLPRN